MNSIADDIRRLADRKAAEAEELAGHGVELAKASCRNFIAADELRTRAAHLRHVADSLDQGPMSGLSGVYADVRADPDRP